MECVRSVLGKASGKHPKNVFPITAALITDAHITPGHTVLDVATGPGEPALNIAELVGPQGDVWGIDPVPDMVASVVSTRVGRFMIRHL